MWAMGFMGLGLAASAAGSFVGAAIMRGDPVFQPQNPRGLITAVTLGSVAGIGGVIAGFFLFGWAWLWVMIFLLLLGFGLAIDGLKATGRDNLPGIAMLAVVAGVGIQGTVIGAVL